MAELTRAQKTGAPSTLRLIARTGLVQIFIVRPWDFNPLFIAVSNRCDVKNAVA